MLNLEYLSDLLQSHREAASAQPKPFSIAGRPFSFNAEPVIMGVINLSPDSWYRESVCLTAEQAAKRAQVLKAQGAEIIDLGAESTLAKARRLTGKAQNSTLLPILDALRGTQMLLSIETYERSVAETCLTAGAHIINLTGTGDGESIYRVIAEHSAAVIICYVQGRNAREVGEFHLTEDPTQLMYDYFSRQIQLALSVGVERIFIDPGVGFYYSNLGDSNQRIRYQMQTFLNTFRLRQLGYPVCHALPHAFEYFGEEVRSAEPFFAVLAALGKTDLIRTHEVPRVRAVLQTLAQFGTPSLNSPA